MRKPRSRGAPDLSGTRLNNASHTKSGAPNQDTLALTPVYAFEACRQAMLRAWLAALWTIKEPARAQEIESTVKAMLLLGQLHG